MKKIKSYEQYAQSLAVFKEGGAPCAANKMMTRAFWERKGFTCRKAGKADSPEMRALWLDRRGMNKQTGTLTQKLFWQFVCPQKKP